MNLRKFLAVIASLVTAWGITYMHDYAHRYDIVAVAAGSGGAQDTAGETTVRAFIIDHQTGKVWMSGGSFFVGMPLMRVRCTAEQIKSEMGCSESARQEINKK